MNAPNYIWVCHKCGKSNQPLSETCASCGFQAIASEAEIHPETDEERKQRYERNANIATNIWLFFPEGLIAGFLALISPFWAIKLIFDGHLLAALCLTALVSACGYGFALAIRSKMKYMAHLAIACFLLGAWGIDASLTS
jgi:ribosomal protein L37E